MDVAKAARLREYAEAIVGSVTKTVEPNSTGYEVNDAPTQWGLMEPYELAADYLLNHPADDAEPLTEAWLRSVGFDSNRIQLGEGCLYVSEFGSCSIEVENPAEWYGCSHELTLPKVTTRGDVRLLCRALGIVLKATP